MSKQITNSDNIIDSRDVIERLDKLETELTEAYGGQSDEPEMSFVEWIEETADDNEATFQDAAQEYRALKSLADEADCSADWNYGETLIREDAFTDYIEELIKDCYEMPKQLTSGDWPYRHMTIDYEAAADEAKADYMEVDFDGETYLIRA